MNTFAPKLRAFLLTSVSLGGLLAGILAIGAQESIPSKGTVYSEQGVCSCPVGSAGTGSANPIGGRLDSEGNCVCPAVPNRAPNPALNDTRVHSQRPGNQIRSDTYGAAPGGSSAGLGPGAVVGSGAPGMNPGRANSGGPLGGGAKGPNNSGASGPGPNGAGQIGAGS